MVAAAAPPHLMERPQHNLTLDSNTTILPLPHMPANVIEITPNNGVSLRKGVPSAMQMTVLGIVGDGWSGTRFFAPDGRVHKVRRLVTEEPIGMLARVLCRVGYNPWRKARVEYESVEAFELSELSGGLRVAIEEDDDILTQWVEKHDLLRELGEVRSFSDCVALLKRAETPTD
jgi:hypothetical protein